MSIDPTPLLCIIGPTSVGKTAAAHRLCADSPVPIEIIAVDSQQVYRHFDIGTNKPSPAERKTYPYHLIDTRDPLGGAYSVADFVPDAGTAIRDITSRGAVPLLCTGTGYFLLRLLCGMPRTPPPDPRVRKTLQEQLDAPPEQGGGAAALHKRLHAIDPLSAQRIDPANTPRLLRALEIYEITGTPPSQFAPPRTIAPQWNPCIIGLTAPRPDLYRGIEARTDALFAAGLVREVASLYQRGYTPAAAPPMRGIGYRQFFDDTGTPLAPGLDPGPAALDPIRHSITTATKRYAKRQLTFFEHQFPTAAWYPAPDYPAILKHAREFIQNTR